MPITVADPQDPWGEVLVNKMPLRWLIPKKLGDEAIVNRKIRKRKAPHRYKASSREINFSEITAKA